MVEIRAQEAPHIVENVHNQLLKGFIPAVKHVSQSGTMLLKSYERLQEDSTAYITAINELINSTDHASEGAKENGRLLAGIFKEYAKAVHEHQKTVNEFRSIIEKVNAYTREEKDKIKTMHSTYEKEAKEMQRQQKKGTKTKNEVEAFYIRQAEHWNHQQGMRYKFFYTKHKQWLQKYLEVIEKADLSLLRRETSNHEHIHSNGHDHERESQRPVDEPVTIDLTQLSQPPQIEENGRDEVSVRESRQSTRVDEHSHRGTVTNGAITVTRQQSDGESPQPDSRDTSPGGTVSRVPSMRRDTEASAGIALLSNTKRHSQLMPQQVVEPRRSSTLQQQDEMAEMPRQAPVVHARVQSADVIRHGMLPDIPVPNVHVRSHASYDSDLEEAVRYVPPPPSVLPPGVARAPGERRFPGAIPVFGMLNTNEAAPARYQPPAENRLYTSSVTQYDAGAAYQPRSRSPIPPLTSNNSYMNSPEQQRRYNENHYPITEEELNRPRYHVESNYNPSVSPAYRPPPKANAAASEKVVVPAPFSPSQYGSILIVNDDFNASSGEQITVNRGDKVILLKCGTRGWVFVRETVSGRTGWIPSPYVNK